MTDTDNKTTDQPVVDDKKVVDSQSDKTDVKAKVDPKPVSDTPAPAAVATGDGDQATRTDQHGRQLFEVTCSSCGNKAQVPFKPSGDRPVYCRDCYMKQKNDRGPQRQF